MIDRTLVFPAQFVWGSATAAHQVEGNNRHNDWWEHELAPDTNAAEASGIACDHYRRYADDFRLLRSLGHRHHRLSIEWSRIEPAEGEIDAAEIDHYRRVFASLRELGIEPWVTLHHFTTPSWLARRGGFARRENLEAFRRFVEQAARAYGDVVSHWCTINEPTVVAEMGYRFAYFPPRIADEAIAADVLGNLFRAHALACEVVKETAKLPPEIGITLAVQAHEPLRPASESDVRLASRRDAESTGACYDALRTGVLAYPGRPPEEVPGLKSSSTFVGIQYYSRVRYDGESNGPAAPDFERPITQMGWEIYPEGFGPLLRRAAATGLPVLVTENGVCVDDDSVRIEYIADHLAVIDQVRREGADIRGYFYWSAMDNFEWNFGYGPKFGLIEVDRQTLERRPRPSAYFFQSVIQEGKVTPDLVKRA